MNTVRGLAILTASVAAVIGLGTGTALADGGSSSSSSGTWPASLPLPTSPGQVVSQTSTTATVRSTDTVLVVEGKLDALYVTQKGCVSRAAVNKPRDYFCHNAATNKTDEVYFTFAAHDPTVTNPYRSQSNAFYAKG